MSNNSIFTEKLRSLGLRPTQQRIAICKLLFDRKDTFHFTIDDLKNSLKNTSLKKVSLATIYNTIHALKDKGYLKEISINSEKTYFDTNISNHHHFFDESKRELIDLEDKDVGKIKIKKSVPGKKITSIEVLVKIANNN
tara:strand:- start:125 stop:541 length:417 start_codon:yes stop_codon:yes gene_type:complete